MKKLFTCCFALFVSANCLYAQAGYVRVGVGYALPEGTQSLVSVNNASSSLYDVNKVSFSSGAHAVIGGGYMFTKNIGLEIAADFLLGSKTYTEKNINVLNPAGSYYSDQEATYKAKLPIYLLPGIVMQTGGDKLNIYARGSLALPLGTQVTTESKYTYYNALKSVEDLQETLKLKTTLGFAGAMGAQYKASDNLAIWAEFNILLSNIYVKQADITNHSIEGTALTNPAVGTTIKYGNNGTINNMEQPTYSLPFSNAGLQVGVSFSFAKPKSDNNKRQQK